VTEICRSWLPEFRVVSSSVLFPVSGVIVIYGVVCRVEHLSVFLHPPPLLISGTVEDNNANAGREKDGMPQM